MDNSLIKNENITKKPLVDDVLNSQSGLEVTDSERDELKKLISDHARMGQRFTWARQMIYLFIHRAKNRGMSAYELLDSMRNLNARAQPISVYRALDYLIEMELVVKIQNFSRFHIRKTSPRQVLSFFYVCTHCGIVLQIEDEECEHVILKMLDKFGSRPGHNTIEINIICKDCIH